MGFDKDQFKYKYRGEEEATNKWKLKMYFIKSFKYLRKPRTPDPPLKALKIGFLSINLIENDAFEMAGIIGLIIFKIAGYQEDR